MITHLQISATSDDVSPFIPDRSTIIANTSSVREHKSEVTILLERLGSGDPSAEDELLPRVYRELHVMAMSRLRAERRGHTLQATALVNEAYLKVCRGGLIDWKNRAHFFAVAARVMRNILTDYARHRRTQLHGIGPPIDFERVLMISSEHAEVALVIDELLKRLAQVNPRQAKVVEMRFFAGLTEEEIADIMGVSSRTVKRDWLMARAWLHKEWKRT